MTLDTSIRIIDPVNVRELFHYCRSVLGCTDQHRWVEKHDSWRDGAVLLMNHGGQGLSAWLMVYYGQDGPLVDAPEDDQDREVWERTRRPLEYAIEVSFDTAYSYSGPEGGCASLHAGLVRYVGMWCEKRGARYSWQNEFSGEWFTDWRAARDELGDAGLDEHAWRS